MKSVAELRLDELRKLEEENGVICPKKVVDFARDESTALHSAFEWDNGVAAEKYRWHQARNLIRVMVTIIDNPKSSKLITVRAFISLKEDRDANGDGGYKYMPPLLKTDAGRRSVLETALAELDSFQEKYAELDELTDVFESVKAVRKRLKG